MTNWVNRNKTTIIRSAFLVPIILVAIISISHVISWYDLANPLSWAIYLSIAIEIAAMSSIAAASVKVKGFSVWFVFIIVTLIQFIGNIYFCYVEIDVASKEFKDWVELTQPLFEMMGSDLNDILAQKRWLAILEGGLLPLISLTCLHFFIQYEDVKPVEEIKLDPQPEITSESETTEEAIDQIVEDIIAEIIEEAEDSAQSEIQDENQIEEISEHVEEKIEELAKEEILQKEIEDVREVIEEIISEKKNKLEEAIKNKPVTNAESVVVKPTSAYSSKMKRIHRK